jgi:hypothetical protein
MTAPLGPIGPAGGGALEIEFAAGTQTQIISTVDAVTLKAVVGALPMNGGARARQDDGLIARQPIEPLARLLAGRRH